MVPEAQTHEIMMRTSIRRSFGSAAGVLEAVEGDPSELTPEGLGLKPVWVRICSEPVCSQRF